MVDVQELTTRGRMLMSEAPGRYQVFNAVNGRRNTQEIAKHLRKHVNNTRRDLTLLSHAELIRIRVVDGKPLYKDGFPVYEKMPLAQTLSERYFLGAYKLGRRSQAKTTTKKAKKTKRYKTPQPLRVPTETELIDIANEGEDQLHEFKTAGTKTEKLVKEIAALLNTKAGGIIFYGIDDNGKASGSDISAQDMDQRLQNAIRTTIKPRAVIKVKGIKVMGSYVLAIVVPPWNGKDVYQVNDAFYLRHGGNTFPMSGDEIKKLLSGRPIS